MYNDFITFYCKFIKYLFIFISLDKLHYYHHQYSHIHIGCHQILYLNFLHHPHLFDLFMVFLILLFLIDHYILIFIYDLLLFAKTSLN